MGQGWEASECMLRCPGFTFYLQKKGKTKALMILLPKKNRITCPSPKSAVLTAQVSVIPNQPRFTDITWKIPELSNSQVLN